MVLRRPRVLYCAEEVQRTIRLVCEAGAVFEVRALDAKMEGFWREGIISGYFNNVDDLLRALPQIISARGIYLTLNPINPALHARAFNRFRLLGQRDPVTSDQDIVHRRWLPIDCDAVRPSGISSSDAEHEVAVARASLIRAKLSAEGWPEPVLADSGNGAHLLYAVDLPANDDGYVQRCLAALAKRFDDDRVVIDQTVFNPARIWRLYGTVAAKGDSTPNRPHRMSCIIDAPPICLVR
jgi:hypothetical protein